MSQYFFTNNNNRKVLYGLDMPTGGYFYTEFYNDEENLENDDEVVMSHDGLTLTELWKEVLSEYSIELSNETIKKLLLDVHLEPHPTQLQYTISSMFGKDLGKMLNRMFEDFSNYKNLIGQ